MPERGGSVRPFRLAGLNALGRAGASRSRPKPRQRGASAPALTGWKPVWLPQAKAGKACVSAASLPSSYTTRRHTPCAARWRWQIRPCKRHRPTRPVPRHPRRDLKARPTRGHRHERAALSAGMTASDRLSIGGKCRPARRIQQVGQRVPSAMVGEAHLAPSQ